MDAMQNELDNATGRLSHMDELVRRCEFLEARCESLERYVQILTKDSRCGCELEVLCTTIHSNEPLDQPWL
jgi:hypothetical protein